MQVLTLTWLLDWRRKKTLKIFGVNCGNLNRDFILDNNHCIDLKCPGCNKDNVIMYESVINFKTKILNNFVIIPKILLANDWPKTRKERMEDGSYSGEC